MKMIKQIVPAWRSKAQFETLGNLATQSATLGIIHHLVFSHRALQLLLVELTHLGHQRSISGQLRIHGFGALIVNHTHTSLTGDGLNRLLKIQVIKIHHKINRIAAFATTKAMINLFIRCHRKGRRLLLMKRTASLVILAGFFQRHTSID